MQLAVNAVLSRSITAREANRLLWHLDRLAAVTQLPVVGAYKPDETIPRIEIEIAPPYLVDWPRIKNKLTVTFPQAPEIDVVLAPRGRGRLLVHLEDAPGEETTLELETLPPWATRIDWAIVVDKPADTSTGKLTAPGES